MSADPLLIHCIQPVPMEQVPSMLMLLLQTAPQKLATRAPNKVSLQSIASRDSTIVVSSTRMVSNLQSICTFLIGICACFNIYQNLVACNFRRVYIFVSSVISSVLLFTTIPADLLTPKTRTKIKTLLKL